MLTCNILHVNVKKNMSTYTSNKQHIHLVTCQVGGEFPDKPRGEGVDSRTMSRAKIVFLLPRVLPSTVLISGEHAITLMRKLANPQNIDSRHKQAERNQAQSTVKQEAHRESDRERTRRGCRGCRLSLTSSRTTRREQKRPLAWTGTPEVRTIRVLPIGRKGWTCIACGDKGCVQPNSGLSTRSFVGEGSH
jgi:hypothetical protein